MSRLSGKLFVLGLQHAVRPLSIAFKNIAGKTPPFKAFCVSIGRRVHSVDSISPIAEVEALETGAATLAECSLVGLLTLLILYQTSKSNNSGIQSIESDVRVLQLEIDDLKSQLRDQSLLLNDFVIPYGTNPSVLSVDESGKPNGKPKSNI